MFRMELGPVTLRLEIHTYIRDILDTVVRSRISSVNAVTLGWIYQYGQKKPHGLMMPVKLVIHTYVHA